MTAVPGRNQPCPCGSGRKYKHCCGNAAAPAAAPAAPRPDSRLATAARRLQENAPADTARLCRAILRQAPRQPHAHYLLAMALRLLDRHEQALASFEAAFAAGLDDPAAHYQFARLLVALGDWQRAEAELRTAIARKPDFALACRDLGNVCYESRRHAEAADWYRRATRHDPHDWTGWHNLAHALYRLDRYDEAIATLDEVIGRAPERPEPYATQATLYELDHDLAAAERSAGRALERDPTHSTALVVLAKLATRRGDAAGALALLDRADPMRMTDRQPITWHSERGRALDRLGRYAEAFADYTESGRLLAGMADAGDEIGNRIARMATVERAFATLPPERPEPADAALPQPIFVLGFFRSGTTLLERILGAHPQIAPVGELPFIGEAHTALEADSGGYPAGLFALPAAERRALLTRERDRYIERVRALPRLPGDARLFVDKAPFNSEHFGLIRLLFPDAPVIHAIRHPLDTVLSSYFINFLDAHPWSFALDTTASLYARIHAHMKTMGERLPDRLMPVRYEDLVADPQKIVERLLGFVGVPWNDACLRFHEHARGVRTASYEQVSRPLYSDSVYRFRNYLPYIDATTLAHLQPAIASLGYDLAASGPTDRKTPP